MRKKKRHEKQKKFKYRPFWTKDDQQISFRWHTAIFLFSEQHLYVPSQRGGRDPPDNNHWYTGKKVVKEIIFLKKLIEILEQYFARSDATLKFKCRVKKHVNLPAFYFSYYWHQQKLSLDRARFT
jgi:hypothetical protein